MNPLCGNCEEREATIWYAVEVTSNFSFDDLRCVNDQFRLCEECDQTGHAGKLTSGHTRMPLKLHEKVTTHHRLRYSSPFIHIADEPASDAEMHEAREV
jgi:hypothetical protein